MGHGYSFLQAEIKTWLEHTLLYDLDVREANMVLLSSFKNDEPLYLSYTNRSWGSINFQHWFITDRIHFLEFGSPNNDIYTARVLINTSARNNYTLDSGDGSTGELLMNNEIRERMRMVLGMCNYSLCLRNCEHVANFVFRGVWLSYQMEEYDPLNSRSFPSNIFENMKGFFNRKLINIFKRGTLGEKYKLVNTFPALIRPHVYTNQRVKIYSFLKNNAISKRFDYYLDSAENTFNILMVGPAGSGKSHLVNTFFNQKLCESKASFHSATRDIYFVRGKHKILNNTSGNYEERTIIVSDTIGLCDSKFNEIKVLSFIKGRVNKNFTHLDAVLIVINSTRLAKCFIKNIKTVLLWLRYSKRNAAKFVFVVTHSENLDENEKNKMSTELKGIFKMHRAILPNGDEVSPILFTGFIPENLLNEITKERVKDFWEKLIKIADNPGKLARIEIKKV